MTIAYTWKVTGLKTQDRGENNSAVVQTTWNKIGTDSLGNEGVFSGATPFTVADVPQENFVPFDQLTEEIVLGWIKKIVVGTYEEHVDEQIRQEINKKINIVQEPTLPWSDIKHTTSGQ
jgi:hypothetical protein